MMGFVHLFAAILDEQSSSGSRLDIHERSDPASVGVEFWKNFFRSEEVFLQIGLITGSYPVIA
jgi:hypothetical protein